MRWKIWYVDTEYEVNDVAEWKSLPVEGVVAVLEFISVINGIQYTRIASGSDWYWLEDDGSAGQNGDSTMQVDYWLPYTGPDNGTAKKGKWVSEERLAQVDTEIISLIKVN